MSKNKFPRSVSFNTNNAVDQAILDFVKRRNFSGYVKQLILADMRAKGIEIPSKVRKNTTPIPQPESRLEQLKRQLSDKRINDNSSNDTDT